MYVLQFKLTTEGHLCAFPTESNQCCLVATRGSTDHRVLRGSSWVKASLLWSEHPPPQTPCAAQPRGSQSSAARREDGRHIGPLHWRSETSMAQGTPARHETRLTDCFRSLVLHIRYYSATTTTNNTITTTITSTNTVRLLLKQYY